MNAYARIEPVTVHELLHLGVLAQPCLVAGEEGATAQISAVRHIERLDEVADVRPGTALVLAGEAARGGWAVEMALRLAWERVAACVVAPIGWDVAISTWRLADRLNVPLLTADYTGAVATTADLTTLVRHPAATRTAIVAEVARQLAACPRNPRALIGVLNKQLPATDVCLLTPERRVVAGRAAAAERAVAVPLHRGRYDTPSGPVLVEAVRGPDDRVAMCVVGALSGRPGPWVDTVADTLAIAAGPLGSWTAIERLTVERDARLRGSVLAELLAGSESVGEQGAEQWAKLGWRLQGWHIGIHLTVVVPAETQTLLARTPTLVSDLERVGVHGPVVERADGWSAWVDYDNEPGPRTPERIVAALRSMLADRPGDLLLAAGVGGAGGGIAGLRSSLTMARDAASLAATAGPGTVEHSGDLGLRRLLATPLGSSGFRTLACRLLEPLCGGEDDALLGTLTAFLDSACSSSDTASRLGIHRNTVTRRVERAVELLGVDLDSPGERLALHLACHALRARYPGAAVPSPRGAAVGPTGPLP